ncbi:hypothetical protein MMC17_004498 [Xylographa soralifera]|nr:hypothetical protein [Xylographa soralifera]
MLRWSLNLFVGWHAYGALGKQDANSTCQEATAIELLGTPCRHVDYLLDVGNDHDRLTERRKEDLKDGALEFRSLGGKTSEALSSVLCVLDEVEYAPKSIPSRLLGARNAWEWLGQGFPVNKGQ